MTSNVWRTWSNVWKNPGPDEGWSWMIVLGLWISGYAGYGMCICMGVVYPAFASSMRLSPDIASWPFFIATVALNITGIVVPILTRYFSIRQIIFSSMVFMVIGSLICFFSPRSVVILALFYGIPVGVLIGCFNQASFIIISHYFRRLRATAIAIATTSGSVAMLTFSVLTQKMSEHYEYRGTVLLIGAVVAQCLPSTLLFRPRNADNFHSKYFNSETTVNGIEKVAVSKGLISEHTKASDPSVTGIPKEMEKLVSTGSTDKPRGKVDLSGDINENEPNLLNDIARLLKMYQTVIVVLPDATMFIAFYTTFLLMVDHGYRSGISQHVITASFIVFGTSSLLTRILIAAIADKNYISKQRLVNASILLKIYTCVIYATWTTPATYLLNAVVVPLTVSKYHAFRLEHITWLFHNKDVPLIMSFSSVLICIFAVVSPKLIGVSMALTGDYRALWAFIASLLALSILLMTLESTLFGKRRNSQNNVF